MAEPSFYANPRRAADVTREHQSSPNSSRITAIYAPGAELAEAPRSRRIRRDDARCANSRRRKLPNSSVAAPRCAKPCCSAMIPPEPTDSRNTVMEIRAGTGATRPRCLPRTCTGFIQNTPTRRLEIQPMSSSFPSGRLQGSNFPDHGSDVYKQLKFESASIA